MHTKGIALISALVIVAAGTAGWTSETAAGSVVKVTLWDQGMDRMGIKTDRSMVPPGSTTFQVVNQSSEFVHEMVLVRSPGTGKPLPYDAAGKVVKEEDLQDLGEVADLDPGKSGDLTVTLEPGEYFLICNEPSHFKHGMSTTLEVR